MANRGLGTGLGALFGDAAANALPNDFEYVPIAKLEPRPEQPRVMFTQDKIDELADSIREHGVLSPLTVRSVDGGFYQIIAGERRWRAARAAGLTEVPVRVIVADDKKAMELALVENLQREDLNPIEEAAGYRALIDEFGLTQEEVARRMSKSRPVVANALRLLSLPDIVIERVEKGELHAGSARALLAIKDEASIISAANQIAQKKLTVREVELLVKKINSEKADYTPKSKGIAVDYIDEAQNTLSRALGRRVKIVQGKQRGRIEIEYYDEEDFEGIYYALVSLSGESL